MPVIAQLSDIHFGAHVEELEQSLLVDLTDQRPDLIVISGDLTQRARRAEFAAARAFLERLPAPVLSVVGNHDIPLLHLGKRLLTPTARYERYITDRLDPVTAMPGFVVMGMDTMPPWRWKAAHVSRRQAELVRQAFGAAAPADAWRILVTHHPLLPASRSDMLGGGRVVAAAAESGVAVLLAGHTHLPAIDLVDLQSSDASTRAVAVVSGTAISRRTREIANAYALLTLAERMVPGARMDVQIRQPAGDHWETTRRERFTYEEHGLAFAP